MSKEKNISYCLKNSLDFESLKTEFEEALKLSRPSTPIRNSRSSSKSKAETLDKSSSSQFNCKFNFFGLLLKYVPKDLLWSLFEAYETEFEKDKEELLKETSYFKQKIGVEYKPKLIQILVFFIFSTKIWNSKLNNKIIKNNVNNQGGKTKELNESLTINTNYSFSCVNNRIINDVFKTFKSENKIKAGRSRPKSKSKSKKQRENANFVNNESSSTSIINDLNLLSPIQENKTPVKTTKNKNDNSKDLDNSNGPLSYFNSEILKTPSLQEKNNKMIKYPTTLNPPDNKMITSPPQINSLNNNMIITSPPIINPISNTNNIPIYNPSFPYQYKFNFSPFYNNMIPQQINFHNLFPFNNQNPLRNNFNGKNSPSIAQPFSTNINANNYPIFNANPFYTPSNLQNLIPNKTKPELTTVNIPNLIKNSQENNVKVLNKENIPNNNQDSNSIKAARISTPKEYHRLPNQNDCQIKIQIDEENDSELSFRPKPTVSSQNPSVPIYNVNDVVMKDMVKNEEAAYIEFPSSEDALVQNLIRLFSSPFTEESLKTLKRMINISENKIRIIKEYLVNKNYPKDIKEYILLFKKENEDMALYLKIDSIRKKYALVKRKVPEGEN